MSIMEGANGALDVAPDGTVRAFILVKRRNDSWEVDGLEYRLASDLHVASRDVVFRDWNAGWHPHYESDGLHHFAYDGRWFCIGTRHLPRVPNEVGQTIPVRAQQEQGAARARRLPGFRVENLSTSEATWRWLRQRFSAD